MTVARKLVETLAELGVDRAFCIPGESYLAVLDALRDSSIDTVAARQEGGAAMMAEADAKLTGRPGVCLVTRGPGAANASAGVHVAQQDSTPLLLIVGQVASTMLGRDAFQEVDYAQFYGGMAKGVYELTADDDVAVVVSEAYRSTLAGRAGPVILVIPEDLQRRPYVPCPGTAASHIDAPFRQSSDSLRDSIKQITPLLKQAQRPMILAGGPGWSADGVAALRAFAESWQIPASVVFRRQQLFDHDHPLYAGDCGLGINPQLRRRIEQADLVLVLGTRLSEIPSQGYTLLEEPIDGQILIHVHPTETGRFPFADLVIGCHPEACLRSFPSPEPTPDRPLSRQSYVQEARAQFESWTTVPAADSHKVHMGQIVLKLRAALPDDAIITNGAGNYASWVHRYFRFRRFGTQVAPTSGSMGYGLPAAVAAKLRFPQRDVVCFAGDGCFQMTGLEFGTAVQQRAALIVIVVDNGMYGTIRMHQELHFPHRVHATDLVNPDFAALAHAYGAFGETVRATSEFEPVFAAARSTGGPALIHILADPNAIAPSMTLS